MKIDRIWLCIIASILLILAANDGLAKTKTETKRDWHRIGNCRLVQHPANDGDSFHVECDGERMVVRLYFVDTPETSYSSYNRSRLGKQASYWGISVTETIKLGKKATSFTQRLLNNTNFTIYTKYDDARGSGEYKRYYALIKVGNRDLAEELVLSGLARVYGYQADLPDGTTRRWYIKKLRKAENKARVHNMGAWKEAE